MIELSVDQQAFIAMGKAMKSASDGKLLRREFVRNVKSALEPAKDQVRNALMAISSAGLGASPPLRLAIVRQLRVEARLSGHSAGARIRVRKTGMPREFKGAAKALAESRGWRHPVFGDKAVYVTQTGDPDYFDRTISVRRRHYREAVLAAMETTARSITRKV